MKTTMNMDLALESKLGLDPAASGPAARSDATIISLYILRISYNRYNVIRLMVL
jgi:hypothetical protein